MRIIGIDPGYAIVGFGVVEYDGHKFTMVEKYIAKEEKDGNI